MLFRSCGDGTDQSFSALANRMEVNRVQYSDDHSTTTPVTWVWVGMLGIKVGAHHPHVSYVVTLAMAKWRRGFSRLGAHSSGPDSLQV